MAYDLQDSGATSIGHLAGSVRFSTGVNRRGTLRWTTVVVGAFGTLDYVSAGGSVTLVSGDAIDLIGTAGSLPVTVGEDVYVDNGSGTKLFGGTVEEISESDLTEGSATHRKAEYLAVDFDEIAARRIVAASYTAQTAGATVSDLITTYLAGEGVTAGTIDDGPVVVKAVFNYVPVRQALDELAALAGFYWQIDVNKALQFRSRLSALAPLSLTTGNRPYRRIQITRSRSRYRNSQYVRAGLDLTDSQAETITGDGTTRAFTVEYPIGAVSLVETNVGGGGWTAKTFGVLGVDTGKDFWYSVGKNVFSQDAGGTLLTSSDQVRITYQGQYPIIVLAEDSDEIAARAAVEGGSGTYEAVENDASIADDEVAEDKAAALLSRYGSLPVMIDFDTDEVGIAAGQLLTVTLTDHELDDTYLVESTSVRAGEDNRLVYSVRAVSNDADGGWVQYFRRLAESGTRFVIRENEVLVIVRTPKDTLTVDDLATTATSTTSHTVNGAEAFVGFCEIT